MIYLRYIWFFLNIVLIILILIRNPNEQSLQETISPLNVFESAGSAEENLDKLINVLICCYFILSIATMSSTLQS